MGKTKVVLITGGAGFLGSHLAGELLARGHRVRVLDNLARRAHDASDRPRPFDSEVELVVGDVRDGAVVERALDGVEAVFHFAAAVGSGESVFELDRCTSVNHLGTAVLMDRIVRSQVERLLVASSRTIYGEGLYRDRSGAAVEVRMRSPEHLRRGEWDPIESVAPLTPAATPESKAPFVTSVYARSKHDQERMCLRMGRAFGIPTAALRFFDLFGPGQPPQSPYATDLAATALRIAYGRRPLVSEDGLQTRDLLHVRDAVLACRLALESSAPIDGALNIASGRPRTAYELAQRMAAASGAPELEPKITGEYRIGAVRHCFADVSRAERLLGFTPKVDLDEALGELVEAARPACPRPRLLKPPRKAYSFPVKEVEFGLGGAP